MEQHVHKVHHKSPVFSWYPNGSQVQLWYHNFLEVDISSGPIITSIYNGFSIAMLNNHLVSWHPIIFCVSVIELCSWYSRSSSSGLTSTEMAGSWGRSELMWTLIRLWKREQHMGFCLNMVCKSPKPSAFPGKQTALVEIQSCLEQFMLPIIFKMTIFYHLVI